MKYPPPRYSKYSNYYVSKNLIDYDMKSPLNTTQFPCKNYKIDKPTFIVNDKNIKVELDGTAIHNGGHCFFSLSYDNINFVVIKEILTDCMLNTMSYDIQLPSNIKTGNVIFAWSWINSIGNREYYMNCADIYIENGIGNGILIGKKLFVCNINDIIIPEFRLKSMYSGLDLIKKQPIITISKNIPKTVKNIPTKTVKNIPTKTVKNIPTKTLYKIKTKIVYKTKTVYNC